MKKLGITIIIVSALGIGVAAGWLAAHGGFDSGMSKETCKELETKIRDFSLTGGMGTTAESMTARALQLKELNNVYSKNCVGIKSVFNKVKPSVPVLAAKTEKLPERTCEAVEIKMLEKINDENEIDARRYDAYEYFIQNARIYADLMRLGCPENSEKFRALAIRQLDIATALQGEFNEHDAYDSNAVQSHANRMQVYKQVHGESEFIQEARRVMEKARHLGEPALQFLGAIEKVFAE
ncbi:MAG: hypothetical protein FWG39_01240 [Alphaproteobacteria bacterium]|nr:hypothetical protein [Alphaproteobacteria bacterium]